MIITTPLAARLPYNEVEAASLRTVMLSTSLVLILESEPSNCTPSNIIKGLFEALKEPIPLTLILGPAPGWPLENVEFTPAISP